MLLNAFATFGEVSDYDPATGVLTRTTDNSAGQPGGQETLGHYATLDNELVVFARVNGRLQLRIGGTVLPIADNTVATHRRAGAFRTVEIRRRGQNDPVATLRYSVEELVPIEYDPTPFVSAEDFDFGLFIANVITDQGRRERIFTRR